MYFEWYTAYKFVVDIESQGFELVATTKAKILGFITIVASAANLQSVVSLRDGLGNTGRVLLIGPSQRANTFASSEQSAIATSASHSAALNGAQVHYIFEPTLLPTQAPGTRGENVAVGAVRPQNHLVQWILLVEETHSEAFAPVVRLRKIILACAFGTTGATILLVPLLAHWAVAPVRRLRASARKSVEREITPRSPAPEPRQIESESGNEKGNTFERAAEHTNKKSSAGMWLKRLRCPLRRFNSSGSVAYPETARGFRIPGRVKERKHCVTDELTEWTKTYNEMSDKSYNRLEERVAERTRVLEKAKLAGESANESETLFIANISHELKTPLNGILECVRKHQIDQAIQIEEKEFMLSDVRSQLAIIFRNQVQEKRIDFSVNFVSGGMRIGASPSRFQSNTAWQTGRHGALGLKFTPENGKVEVRILLVEEPSRLETVALDDMPRRDSRIRPQTGSSTNSSIHGAADVTDDQTKKKSVSQSNIRQVKFQFEVQDKGPVIPSHLHRRIFDPFVQGDLGLNRKYGGTGLGLSICAQLSRIMGGDILLDSEEGKWSLFTLRIPLGMLALEEVYDVTIAKDGQEAYDTVKTAMEKGDVFDLIFTDIQMPILDGIESTRLIRQMAYSAPIVALSAFAEESNTKDCMDCGMGIFLRSVLTRNIIDLPLRGQQKQ
ncbi:CheY-like superfamily [Penicillium mononematosum]|uniref:CheY-like superfamily n=1 Tax=Penicillium mononematosum TaxID=268346 RepID=UPI0025479382|nr:CheY-like superfamily [Penicillium mononematosum]KAJ6189961.1 CheY-like superfamily [Penicillium mononematosum]